MRVDPNNSREIFRSFYNIKKTGKAVITNSRNSNTDRTLFFKREVAELDATTDGKFTTAQFVTLRRHNKGWCKRAGLNPALSFTINRGVEKRFLFWLITRPTSVRIRSPLQCQDRSTFNRSTVACMA